jgi:ubiquinol-cytochrome c reductase cytochrome b subunit
MTLKDAFALCAFLAAFSVMLFFAPNFFGDPTNFVPAKPLLTPADIKPEWYFLPFYAILRAVPSKLGGVTLMFASMALLVALPWLDTSPVRSGRFRPLFQKFFAGWLLSLAVLGLVGAHSPEGIWVVIGRLGTLYYFAYLLVILPVLGKREHTLPLPEGIGKPVLGGGPLPRAALATQAE